MLESIGPQLWSASTAMKMPGGVRIGLRSTIARLDDGSVAIVSPFRFDDETAAEIERIGPVRHLIAPNAFHHMFLRAAKERWPEARLFGPPAVAKKRADLPWDVVVEDVLPPPLVGAFDAVRLAGSPRMDELVLFFRPARAVIVADLIFNVTKPPNAATSFALTLMGTRGKLATSRMLYLVVGDRTVATVSLEPTLAWDVARIVPAHGEVYDAPDAKERYAEVLGGFFKGLGRGAS